MTPHIIAIDHLMMCVHDHARTQSNYERMGFVWREVRQLAPMGGGSAGGNGGSACTIFRSRTAGAANYLEFSRVDPVTGNPLMKSILGGDEGLGMIVHSIRNADAMRDRWIEAGLDFAPIWKVPLAPLQNSSLQVEQTLKIVMPEPDSLPIAANAVEWVELSEFEHEPFRNHPNSVQRWTRMTCVCPAEILEETLDRYSLFYGNKPESDAQGYPVFNSGAASLRWVESDDAARLYPQALWPSASSHVFGLAVTLEVASIDAVADCLRLGKVDHVIDEASGRIMVGAAHCGGFILEFVEQQKDMDI